MSNLANTLAEILPTERIKTRLIDRYAFASNASHFFIVPEAVVQPLSIGEIQALFTYSQKHKIPLAFRAAGTSLSGQAATKGILIDLSRFWRTVTPENNGLQVRTQPAVIGGNLNIALKKYGRKMGPDPASINAAMMGGILANNASGMCCGVQHNSYHTLRFITFVLPNGLIFNTEKPEDYARFESEAADIAEGLRKLRQEIIENPLLADRIRQKYQQKNTTGYGLNAFIDFEHPLDILAHLLIGSEGTLAFIAEAVMNTLPDLPQKMTGLLYFDTPEAACSVIPELKQTGAEALELMDRASLRSVENMAGLPPELKTLTGRNAAILLEFQSDTEGGLLEKYEKAKPILEKLPLIKPLKLTRIEAEQAMMWKIRKGLYPSAASIRAKKTATMLEDFTLPTEKLGTAIADIQALFEKYGYTDGIIFGHAKDGNLHFCIAQDFSEPAEIARFEAFNEAIFDLILKKYDGALKAEHGTGRAVAPYVEAEWGSEAYQIMKKLKQLIDPENLLNPDVILTEDKNVHLRDLKIMPIIEAEVDKCVECGFCERRCPSRDFTLTPRQRISIRRSLQVLASQNKEEERAALLKDYAFSGIDTCAVDGMCATDCPVDINTGELIKRLRRENHSAQANKIALKVAQNFGLVEASARFAMRVAGGMNRIFGKNFVKNTTHIARKAIPHFPLWSNNIGTPAARLKNFDNTEGGVKVLYFTSCISRTMGGDIVEMVQKLCKKANIQLIFPENIGKMCCGQIFSSKGFSAAHSFMANQTFEQLYRDTEGGTIPVFTDGTSCTQTLLAARPYLSAENQVKFDTLTILDSIDFAADMLLPRLNIEKPKNRIIFHPVCSATKLGLIGKLQKIGSACALEADIPTFAACCGMAGDRGFYYPELTNAATKLEAAEVNTKTYDGYYSSGKTCEIALSEAVGKPYISVFNLLAEVCQV